MGVPNSAPDIRRRLHLVSPPAVVHWMLASDEGRARFWAESTVEVDPD